MKISISDFLPDSPFCSPAWRWLRATWLRDRPKNSRRRCAVDDAGVKSVLAFLEHKEHVPQEVSLHEAVRIFDGEASRRHKIEAYLLTQEPFHAIAERFGLSISTLIDYHNIFFDVRSRLQAPDWIWACAIRASFHEGFRVGYPGSIWKALAFSEGSTALELAIAITEGSPFPDWLTQRCRSRFELERIRSLGQLSFAALSATTPRELAPLICAREQLRRIDEKYLGTDRHSTGLLFAMEQQLKANATGPRMRARRPSIAHVRMESSMSPTSGFENEKGFRKEGESHGCQTQSACQ